MSNLEERLNELNARLSARASELESRLAARFGRSESAEAGAGRSGEPRNPIPATMRPANRGASPASRPGEPSFWVPGVVRYGLFVGMNKVDRDKWRQLGWEMKDLSGAVPDARNMAAVCRDLGGWLSENETLLEDAKVDVVRAEMRRLAMLAKADDVVLFFYSGHGGPTRLEDPSNDTELCLFDGPYQEAMLREDLKAFHPGAKIVVVIDACHSAGLFPQGQKGRREERASARAFFMPPKGDSLQNVGWIAAAGADETSLDALVDGTGGKFTTFTFINNGWRAGLADGVADWQNRKQVDENAAPPRKSGMVSFYDLALYAQCELGQYLTRGEDKLVPFQDGSLFIAVSETSYDAHVPQFSNPGLLASVIAGRTGVPAEEGDSSTKQATSKETSMNKQPRNFTETVDLDSALRNRSASAPRQAAEPSGAADSVRRAASSNSALSRILKTALGRGSSLKGAARDYKEYIDCSFGTIQG